MHASKMRAQNRCHFHLGWEGRETSTATFQRVIPVCRTWGWRVGHAAHAFSNVSKGLQTRKSSNGKAALSEASSVCERNLGTK